MERHPDANRPGEPAYTAEKRIENGSPVLYVNGRRQAPLLYALSDIPASSPLTAQAQRNMANFARQGVRLFSTDANLCRGWHKAQPYRADFLLGDLAAIVETVPQTVEAMGRCGVAYDRIDFDDLERCDIDRYRCVAMINVCLLTQERRRMVRRRVQGGGRHVLWMNTCGLLDEDACSAALVGEACQIAVAPCPAAASMRFSAPLPPKEVALREAYSVMFKVDDADACPVAVFTEVDGVAAARKPMGDYTNWYFSLFPADADILREIFRSAGAHVYSEHGEALLVGNGLAVVTATDDRPLELTLRNGMVVFVEIPPPSGTMFLVR